MFKKIISLVVFISNLANLSCGNNTVKAELPPEKEIRHSIIETQKKEIEKARKVNKRTFVYNYKLFRINREIMPQKAYTITNRLFFSALSNEFDSFYLDRTKGPYIALKKYAELIKSTNTYHTNAFLWQRAGVAYFKLKKYSKANKYINKAIIGGANNPELYYYKAMLEAYYKGNMKNAALYLKRIPVKSFYSPQDIDYFRGRVEEEQGLYGAAEAFYKKSYAYSPSMFLLHYNLQNFYVKWGHINEADKYTHSAFAYLSALGKPKYRLKAYRMLAQLHRLERKPSFSFHIKLPDCYPSLPNLFYFIRSPYPKRKFFSRGLALPIRETKKKRYDVLKYLTSEYYSDMDDGTGIVFTAGGIMMTNIRVANEKYVPYVRRYFFYTNVIALISPTNRYYVVTNVSKSTNSPDYIVTNADNKIFLTNDTFKTYFATRRFDVDGDGVRDFLVFGIKNTNTIAVDLFSPEKKIMRSWHFPIKSSDPTFVIQDFNEDGRNDVLLFDDDVYKLPSLSLSLSNQTNQLQRPDSP